MSQVFTEETNVASAPEVTLGTVPTTGWRQHQPNTIGKFGNAITKMAREIISSSRQREAGRAVDADSGVDLEFDWTEDAADRDVESIFKSAEKFAGNTGVGRFYPTAVTATGYTVAASGALTNNFLIRAYGFTTAANNGIKQTAGTSTATEIKVPGLVAEAAPPANAVVRVAGWRGTAGTIGLDASGNLTDSASGFATMGLFVGQWIWVGGTTVGTSFANTAYRGYARIKTIAAGLLTLENRDWTVGAADNGATKTIDIYFGSWIRVVGSLHADYRVPSRTVELTLPKLGAANATEYVYARGNMLNTHGWTMQPGNKVTCSQAWIGTITDDPTLTQATGASSAFVPTPGTIGMVTTSSDLARLRIFNVDETGISTDFKDMTITVNNNVSADKQLAVFGASKLIVGRSDWNIDTTIILTSDEVIKAVRDNRQAGMTIAMRNDDAGSLLDLPAIQLDDMPLDLARNESVKVSGKISGVRHPTLNYTASMSRFPYVPAA